MILAPTSGPLGIQPHGGTARMIVQGATVAIGDVVVTSHAHTAYTFPPTTIAQFNNGPFCNVRPAAGNDALHSGFLGVVVDLGTEGTGTVGSEVTVQFGGTCRAKVTAGTAVSRGTRLLVSDTAGAFNSDTTAATGTNVGAIALEALASGTSQIQVLLNSGFWTSTFI